MTSSSSSSRVHSLHLPVETEHQRRALSQEPSQQVKLKGRQPFFEEVVQHGTDVYLPAAHLQTEPRRPPFGSISSMEVNVDMLEHMEDVDILDQDALDVFLSSGGEDIAQTSSLTDGEDIKGAYKDERSLQELGSFDPKSRILSISSTSSDPGSEEGLETPVQSEDEDL